MRRGRLFSMAAALAAGVALAGCGESPEDEARDDGEDVGEAVRDVADATTLQEARDALGSLRDTVADLDPDVRERVQDQVDTQRDSLQATIEAAGSAGSFDDARVVIRSGAQQLRSQADSFRSGENSIANEFWRGFEEGYDGDGD
jgi:hypothetical protein